MNLFILHTDPVIAAKYYCDLHVPKLVVECYQMLGSAVRKHGATDEQMPLTQKGSGFPRLKSDIANASAGSPDIHP